MEFIKKHKGTIIKVALAATGIGVAVVAVKWIINHRGEAELLTEVIPE